MVPIIADKNFQRICALDDFSSFIWTSRYYTAGDFEICTGISMRALTVLQYGFYVLRDDRDDVGIIEKLDIRADADGNDQIVASGRFVTSILGRRIVAEQTQINNKTIDTACATLITDAIISPDIPERQISNFALDGSYTTAKKITIQITGKNLLESITKICEENGIGFKVTIDSGVFTFKMYEGTDRSYGQNVNPYVVFSDQYDNLFSSEYLENYADLVTNVLIAGEGEGTDRTTVWATKDDPTGLDRYEMYQDARNMSTNDGEIPEEEYLEQLEAEALESITSYAASFTGSVDFSGVRYGTDVNLGDICTVENRRWGISINCRLVEVIESTDESGAYTITPTFGI